MQDTLESGYAEVYGNEQHVACIFNGHYEFVADHISPRGMCNVAQKANSDETSKLSPGYNCLPACIVVHKHPMTGAESEMYTLLIISGAGLSGMACVASMLHLGGVQAYALLERCQICCGLVEMPCTYQSELNLPGGSESEVCSVVTSEEFSVCQSKR